MVFIKTGCLAFLTGCAYDGEARNALSEVRIGDQRLAQNSPISVRGDVQKHRRSPGTHLEIAGTKIYTQTAYSYFERGNYGKAITYANEALKRDPDDSLAISIVAVAGLRVSSNALSELKRINNLSLGSKQEAKVLVKIMRMRLDEKVLVPNPAQGRAQ
jgi:tetratricopeptide (TPR) repeat protein